MGGYPTYHVISMTYVDNNDNTYQEDLLGNPIYPGCSASTVATVIIYPDADVSFTVTKNNIPTDINDVAFEGNTLAGDLSGDDFCYDDGLIDLAGVFGTLTSGISQYALARGTGSFECITCPNPTVNAVSNTANNAAKFNPTTAHNDYWNDFYATVGDLYPHEARTAHTIRYNYEDEFGCANYIETVLYVNPLPDPIEVVGGTEDGTNINFTAICVDSPLQAEIRLYDANTAAEVTDFTNYTFNWQLPSGSTGVLDYSGARTLDANRRVTVTGAANANELQWNSSITNSTPNKGFTVSVTVTNNITGCTYTFTEDHVVQALPELTFNGIANGNTYCQEDDPLDFTMTTNAGVIGGSNVTDINNLSYSVTSHYGNTDQPITNTFSGIGTPTVDFAQWHADANGMVTGGLHTSHVITMTYDDLTDNDYQNEFTNCSRTVSITIKIYPDADVTFTVGGEDIVRDPASHLGDVDASTNVTLAADHFCYDDATVDLAGLFGPETFEAGIVELGYNFDLGSGSFSGNGITSAGNNKALFNPKTAHDITHVGLPAAERQYGARSVHTITFTYTDEFGCLNTISKDLYVHPIADPIEFVDVDVSENGTAIIFSEICVESPKVARVELVGVSDYSNYTFNWQLPFGASGAVDYSGARTLDANRRVSVTGNVAANQIQFNSTLTNAISNKLFTISVTVTNNLTGCDFTITEVHEEQSLPVLTFANINNTTNLASASQFCSEDDPLTLQMLTTTRVRSTTPLTNQIIGVDAFTDIADLSYSVVSYKADTPGNSMVRSGSGNPTIDMMDWHTTTIGGTAVGGYHTVHEITMTYQDNVDTEYQGNITSCASTVTATILIYPDADLSFTVAGSDIVRSSADYVGDIGTNVTLAADHFCYDDGNIDLTGLFGPATYEQGLVDLGYRIELGEGVFSGNGVISAGNNKGIFNPQTAHDLTHSGLTVFERQFAARSVHTITYTYTDEFGCSNSISKDLYVNPLPRLVDLGGQVGRIQFDALCLGYFKTGFVELLNTDGSAVTDFTNYEFNWRLPVGSQYLGVSTVDPNTGEVLVTISGDNQITFDTENFVFPISVSVVNTLTGCESTTTESKTQGFPPIPTFTYQGITAGQDLNVQFYQDNPALDNNTLVYLRFELRDQSNSVVAFIERSGDGASPFDLSPAIFTGLDAGDYRANLTLQTIKGCAITSDVVYNADGVTIEVDGFRTITILPVIDVPQSGYEESFASGRAGWYIERASEDGKADTRVSSWEVTSEPGVVFNPDPLFAPHLNITTPYDADGGMIVTDWDSAYYANEISYVYSPAFDLSAFTRPAISFWHWRDFDSSRDGMVVQISDDDGATWTELGDNDLSSGVNWFTNQGISSGPGESGRYPEVGSNSVGVGFADAERLDANSAAIVEWTESRHAISGVDHVNNLVRLRFALSSGSGQKISQGQVGGQNVITSVADGFAFDLINIYEKDKVVLVEQFSSTLSADSKLNEEYIQEGGADHDYDWDLGDQGLWINYYTDLYNTSSSIDQINARNKVDPSTRATYYGVTDVPSTRIAGVNVPYSMDSNPEDFGNGFDAIALEDPHFSIPKELGPNPTTGLRFTSDPAVTGRISVTAEFVPEVTRTEDVELSFYFAVVEKEITGIDTDVYDPTDVIRNALRIMLPGPEGYYYRGPITAGVPLEYSIDWTISGMYDPSQIRVIAFVQYYNDPLKGNTVEQANFIDVVGIPSTVTNVDKVFKGYGIYPNPSDEVVNIDLDEVPEKDVYWKMSDQAGREVMRGKIDRGSNGPVPIDTDKLPSGLYIIQLQSEDRTWNPRKLIIQH
jgi:hypothetical protein